jgi:hypothetical protein
MQAQAIASVTEIKAVNDRDNKTAPGNRQPSAVNF